MQTVSSRFEFDCVYVCVNACKLAYEALRRLTSNGYEKYKVIICQNVLDNFYHFEYSDFCLQL